MNKNKFEQHNIVEAVNIIPMMSANEKNIIKGIILILLITKKMNIYIL